MNKYLNIILSAFIVQLFMSCNERPKYEVRKLFVESENLPEAIRECFEDSYKNRRDTIYNFAWSVDNSADSIIYVYYNADILPKSNLLDGTRKIKIGLLEEKDSANNPLYYVHLYKSEQDKWVRTWNLGNTSFYSDTIVSEAYMNRVLNSWLNVSFWKGLP